MSELEVRNSLIQKQISGFSNSVSESNDPANNNGIQYIWEHISLPKVKQGLH